MVETASTATTPSPKERIVRRARRIHRGISIEKSSRGTASTTASWVVVVVSSGARGMIGRLPSRMPST